MTIGLISGTGLYEFALMERAQRMLIDTPYGEAVVFVAQHGEEEVVFLPRHGKEHGVPPHLINYRANIYALASLGVREVVSFCCVGSLKKEYGPGAMVLVEQFIDQTWGREGTFSGRGAVSHVDMTEPYCPRLSGRLLAAAQYAEVPVQREGVYLCTQGPRFETPAEIRAYQMWGASLVGMTGVPEAQLVREAGLCYASLAVVANYAAGLYGEEAVDVAEISRIMAARKDDLEQIFLALLDKKGASENTACSCREALITTCSNWGF